MVLEPTKVELHLFWVLPRVSYYDWNFQGNPLLIETNRFNENNMVATLDMERLVTEMREKLPELTSFSSIEDPNNPASMIVEVAKKKGIDFIIMMTHGCKGLDRLL